MRQDGWWTSPPALTNKAIRKQVLREMINSHLKSLAGRA
jgi:hypothetical protein